MKILVIQLARLGDILQTLPALHGLKEKYKNAEVHLLVRSTFSDAALLGTSVDKIISFPTKHILGPYVSAPSEQSKHTSLDRLERWTAENLITSQESCYDLLINLTYSEASSYLATLVPARRKVGVTRSRQGHLTISDTWSQYFYSQILGRNLNIIHLNDFFAKACEVNFTWPIPVADVTSPKDINEDKVIMSEAPLIGLQLTASQMDKTLPVWQWKKLVNTLQSSMPNHRLVFFGSEQDRSFIQDVATELDQNRYTIVAGKLRFHENLNIVKRCKWIISPDTALIHFASLVQVPVINISTVQVRPEETGPYGNNNHILYYNLSDIDTLSDAVVKILKNQSSDIKKIPYAITELVKGVRGTYRNEVRSINFKVHETLNLFTKIYYLISEFRCAGIQEDIQIPEIGQNKHEDALDHLLRAHDALCTIKKLGTYGQRFCLNMLENQGNHEILKDEMAKLARIETLLVQIRDTVFLVKPLIDSWKIVKDTSPAETLEEIVGTTEGAYRELVQNVGIILDLIQTSVEKSQERINSTKTYNSLNDNPATKEGNVNKEQTK